MRAEQTCRGGEARRMRQRAEGPDDGLGLRVPFAQAGTGSGRSQGPRTSLKCASECGRRWACGRPWWAALMDTVPCMRQPAAVVLAQNRDGPGPARARATRSSEHPSGCPAQCLLPSLLPSDAPPWHIRPLSRAGGALELHFTPRHATATTRSSGRARRHGPLTRQQPPGTVTFAWTNATKMGGFVASAPIHSTNNAAQDDCTVAAM